MTKRFILLILIMTAVAAGIGVAAIAILYRAALGEERLRLVETAQSQARLMEAVARFDEVYSRDYPEGSQAATIAQIKDAHERYLGFGDTGEFTLARRVGDDIVFVLRHRHYDMDEPQPVPFDSNFAKPMRRALSGQSGTTIGLDYRGVTVLAAHEPVSVLDLGIVAKIDLVEIRAPFLKAAAIVAVIATVLIASGTMLFFRVGNPIIRRIQASEERFRSMAASAQDAIISMDNEGCVTFWNSAAARMFGYDSEEILGRNLGAHVIPEPQRERHAIGFENISLNGQGTIFDKTVELEVQKKDSQKFPVELSLSATAIKDEWQATAIVRDITERRQAQAALKESEEKFRRVLESAADAILIVDERGRILIANSQTDQLFGYARHELIGQPVELFLPEALREKHVAHRRDFSIHPRPRPMGQDFQLLGRRKDGTLVPLEISLSPVYREEELLVTAIIRDITARQEAEAALYKAKEVAEQADFAKSRFLAAASHDLRQPLQTMSLLKAALDRSVHDPTSHQFLRSMSDALRTMEDLLNAFLGISQLESGTITPQFKVFPVSRLLKQIQNECQKYADEKGLELRVVLSHEHIRSDAVLLERVLHNLVFNAIRYTESGKILVGCRRRGSKLRIEIWDTGMGIPEDELTSIFEEFYQVGNPARDRARGLGLGLAIVNHIAKLLGHHIDVRSTLYKGSMFGVEVPISSAEPVHDQAQEPAQIADARARKTEGVSILLVEDDSAVLDSTQILLELAGHRVASASTVRDALLRVEANRHNLQLIITDYTLGRNETGIQLIERIRETMGHNLPAIIITGHTIPDLQVEAVSCGCQLLYKPVKGEQLLHFIDKLSRHPQGR
jgi:PAS domain S-box-containing protein